MMQKDGTKQDEPDDEKPILHLGGASAVFTQNIPSQIQYTALGHLHRYHNIKGHNAPVVYSGSLLEYSFSEAHQQKYVSIIAVQPNQKSEVKKVAIRSGKKLHRKRFENPEEAILWLSKNPNTFVELTLVSDDYLEASVKKQLQQTHSGIVNIIPEIKNQNQKSAAATQINLSQDIRVLFKEYFHAKKGQQPNTEILNLLEAILSE